MATIFAVSELIRQAEGINGGCTIDNEGNSVETSGFVVGGKVPSFVMSGDEPFVTLARWVSDNPSDHYGSWKDSETGLIHIDAVDFVEDRDEAVRLGLKRGEIAIWDAGAGEEIRLADGVDEHGPEPDPFAGHYDESGY